jgi:hypothetical protein
MKMGAKKVHNWLINLSLVCTSLAFCFAILEIACRIIPWAEYDQCQLNNPYHYVERIGEIKYFSPYTTYQERVPLKFDVSSYYAATQGLVSFYTNQYGARWIEPADQQLKAADILVVGDSFTYGHGLRYEDTFIYLLEQKLQDKSQAVSLLNFSKRGIDAEEVLSIYRRLKDTIPHDAVLYGLHINDLIKFPTSYIISNPMCIPWLVERSKGFDFIAKKIYKYSIRKYRIKQLLDPELFTEHHFDKKLQALVTLNETVKSKGMRLTVVLLPILVDLQQHTFRPLYDGIKKSLDRAQIDYIDLTECLDNFNDSDVWVLPFDQHPNKIANKVFADTLYTQFQKRGIIASLVKKVSVEP